MKRLLGVDARINRQRLLDHRRLSLLGLQKHGEHFLDNASAYDFITLTEAILHRPVERHPGKGQVLGLRTRIRQDQSVSIDQHRQQIQPACVRQRWHPCHQ